MLSGFWIQRMWCARYAIARSPYLTYAISRLWRLAPVMIAVSVLTVPLLMSFEVREAEIAGTQTAHFIFSTIFFLGYAIYNPALNVILALLTIPFAFHTVHRNTDKVDKMAADLSYIIYLAHWVGALWFYDTSGSFGERLAVAATCFVLVPIISWLIWMWIDRPLNERRAKWVRSRMPVITGTSAVNEPAGP